MEERCASQDEFANRVAVTTIRAGIHADKYYPSRRGSSSSAASTVSRVVCQRKTRPDPGMDVDGGIQGYIRASRQYMGAWLVRSTNRK